MLDEALHRVTKKDIILLLGDSHDEEIVRYGVTEQHGVGHMPMQMD